MTANEYGYDPDGNPKHRVDHHPSTAARVRVYFMPGNRFRWEAFDEAGYPMCHSHRDFGDAHEARAAAEAMFPDAVIMSAPRNVDEDISTRLPDHQTSGVADGAVTIPWNVPEGGGE